MSQCDHFHEKDGSLLYCIRDIRHAEPHRDHLGWRWRTGSPHDELVRMSKAAQTVTLDLSTPATSEKP